MLNQNICCYRTARTFPHFGFFLLYFLKLENIFSEYGVAYKGKQEKASNDMGKGLTFSDKFSPKDQQINVGDTSVFVF